MPNTLYYCDNLQVLREHLADESVDLVYLDPPFKSNASYNVLFRIATMRLTVERIPQIRAKMYLVLLRGLARYYWISLATNGSATNGSPEPRVAAALISRLALSGEDHGCGREITLRQRDIVRLTVMSRSAVAGGISRLASVDLIRIGDDNSERFSGLVHVPDVDRLKDYALSEVREKQVRPLLPSTTEAERLSAREHLSEASQ